MTRRIPAGFDLNCILSYLHCSVCIDELPDQISPMEYQEIRAGFTKSGLQVWCARHNCNIMHVNFEGTIHQQMPKIPEITRRHTDMIQKKSNLNCIKSYLCCHTCTQEYKIQAGFTRHGLQVWCVRHDCNILHINFEGARHPADTSV